MDNAPDKTPQPTAQPTQVMDIQAPRPVAPVQQAPTSEQQDSLDYTVSQPNEPSLTTVPLAAAPAKEKHSRTSVLAVAIALVIAVAFAVIAVISYTATDENKTSTPTTEVKAVETVTSSDVDDTTKSVDEALNGSDDNADFNDASINDSTLGL